MSHDPEGEGVKHSKVLEETIGLLDSLIQAVNQSDVSNTTSTGFECLDPDGNQLVSLPDKNLAACTGCYSTRNRNNPDCETTTSATTNPSNSVTTSITSATITAGNRPGVRVTPLNIPASSLYKPTKATSKTSYRKTCPGDKLNVLNNNISTSNTSIFNVAVDSRNISTCGLSNNTSVQPNSLKADSTNSVQPCISDTCNHSCNSNSSHQMSNLSSIQKMAQKESLTPDLDEEIRPKSFLHDEMDEFNSIFTQLTASGIASGKSSAGKTNDYGLGGNQTAKILREDSFEARLAATVDELHPPTSPRPIYEAGAISPIRNTQGFPKHIPQPGIPSKNSPYVVSCGNPHARNYRLSSEYFNSIVEPEGVNFERNSSSDYVNIDEIPSNYVNVDKMSDYVNIDDITCCRCRVVHNFCPCCGLPVYSQDGQGASNTVQCFNEDYINYHNGADYREYPCSMEYDSMHKDLNSAARMYLKGDVRDDPNIERKRGRVARRHSEVKEPERFGEGGVKLRRRRHVSAKTVSKVDREFCGDTGYDQNHDEHLNPVNRKMGKTGGEFSEKSGREILGNSDGGNFGRPGVRRGRSEEPICRVDREYESELICPDEREFYPGGFSRNSGNSGEDFASAVRKIAEGNFGETETTRISQPVGDKFEGDIGRHSIGRVGELIGGQMGGRGRGGEEDLDSGYQTAESTLPSLDNPASRSLRLIRGDPRLYAPLPTAKSPPRPVSNPLLIGINVGKVLNENVTDDKIAEKLGSVGNVISTSLGGTIETNKTERELNTMSGSSSVPSIKNITNLSAKNIKTELNKQCNSASQSFNIKERQLHKGIGSGEGVEQYDSFGGANDANRGRLNGVIPGAHCKVMDLCGSFPRALVTKECGHCGSSLPGYGHYGNHGSGRMVLEGQNVYGKGGKGPVTDLVIKYNELCGGNAVRFTDSGTCEGFIRIHLNVYRPISMSVTSRPTSMVDLLVPDESKFCDTEVNSFYLPEDTYKSIHITSDMTTSEVIKTLLIKYNIIDDPSKFALYERRPGRSLGAEAAPEAQGDSVSPNSEGGPAGEGEGGSASERNNLENSESADSVEASIENAGIRARDLSINRRLSNTERPLDVCLRWAELKDPALFSMCSLSLRDSVKGQVLWEEFSVPELYGFLQILEREESAYEEMIRERFTIYKRDLTKRLAKLEISTGRASYV